MTSKAPTPRFDYGRTGNPSTARGRRQLITELEGAAGTVLAPSGLSAVSLALLSVRQRRRPRSHHRQRLPADAPLCRWQC